MYQPSNPCSAPSKNRPHKPAAGTRGTHAPPQENQKRQQEHQAGYAAKQAVGVFHPKDETETGQGQVGIDEAEFGEPPVVFKDPLPLRFAEGAE